MTAKQQGTAVITVTTTDGCKQAECRLTVQKPEIAFTPEYVDLGLSVKWAACNLGATQPEESGDYFAWGEVEPKSEYTFETYKFYETPYYTK